MLYKAANRVFNSLEQRMGYVINDTVERLSGIDLTKLNEMYKTTNRVYKQDQVYQSRKPL